MQNKKTYYFSHDVDARQDIKCAALVSDHGLRGYGFFWMIIETCAQQKEYKLRKFEKLYDALAKDFKINTDECKNLIQSLIRDYGLLIEDDKYIWSESLLIRMKKKDDRIQQLIEAGRIGGKKSSKTRQLNKKLKPSSSNPQAKLKPSSSNINKNINTFPSTASLDSTSEPSKTESGIGEKGKKGKGNGPTDKFFFDQLRSGIYREELFDIFDNMSEEGILKAAEEAAYAAIKSLFMNNDVFLREEHKLDYPSFRRDIVVEKILERFPFKIFSAQEMNSPPKPKERNLFVATICNTVADTMADILQGHIRLDDFP